MNSIRCHFPDCKADTEYSLLCEFHRRTISNYPGLKKEIKNMWHDVIVERKRCGSMYKCFHCNKIFGRDRVCGDHVKTVGSRKDLEYDIRNGVSSCSFCNTNPNIRKDLSSLSLDEISKL